jgi:hypothetical protein
VFLIMSLYERLPSDFLIQFHNEVKKMSSNGLVTKNSHYELGLIIAVALKRGIQLDKLKDLEQNVDQEILLEFKCRNSIIRKPNKKATDKN